MNSLNALRIIRQEHSGCRAVLTTLYQLVAELDAGAGRPDFELFRSMLDYMVSFLDSFHHPKEDDYLFRLMAARDATTSAMLAEIEEEHSEGRRRVAEVRRRLDAYEVDPETGFAAFRDAVRAYVEFELGHIEREEMEVFPQAERILTAEDWRSIGAAFADNRDPVFGDAPRGKYRKLFHEIVSRTPEPFGLAPKA